MAVANTIIAGAQKSGTTALCRFLAAHPHCLVSEPKETNFFSRAENVARPERYERYFRHAGPAHRVFVDGTTTYMADPAIAPRIRACLGDEVKLVFILRSPASRTYSSFLHMLKRGHDRRTADEVFLGLPDDPAAAADAERMSIRSAVARSRIADRPYRRLYDDALWNFRYVGNSLYSALIASYLHVFRPERVLILCFEEITRDLETGRHALASFLDIDPLLFPPSLPKANQTRIPDFSSPWTRLFEQARWIKRGNFTLVRPDEINASPGRPSEAVREKLSRIFADEVAHWSRHLGRDLRAIGW